MIIGTDAFRNLCMVSEVAGPNGVWDRPFEGGGNMTGIWSQTGPGGPNGGPGVGPGGWPDGGWPPGTDGDTSFIGKEMDVNECSAFPGLCGHGRCKNMMGTFVCECFPGYEPVRKSSSVIYYFRYFLHYLEKASEAFSIHGYLP